MIENIKDIIIRSGITIISYSKLNESQIKFAKNSFRGGYWGKGNYLKSGGRPFALLICFNYSPDLLYQVIRHF